MLGSEQHYTCYNTKHFFLHPFWSMHTCVRNEIMHAYKVKGFLAAGIHGIELLIKLF